MIVEPTDHVSPHLATHPGINKRGEGEESEGAQREPQHRGDQAMHHGVDRGVARGGKLNVIEHRADGAPGRRMGFPQLGRERGLLVEDRIPPIVEAAGQGQQPCHDIGAIAEKTARLLAVHGAGGDEVPQDRKKVVLIPRWGSRRVARALRGWARRCSGGSLRFHGGGLRGVLRSWCDNAIHRGHALSSSPRQAMAVGWRAVCLSSSTLSLLYPFCPPETVTGDTDRR